ncbi:hypothetical protein [Burkholderia cepacia]|uniref:hypothetical protein n=1 Tax=Burkholderia cepacia TaxID=292 RepID=UPI00158986A2|nr:hypothetical protein [Burkholderia cepacia]MCA8114958.1 hypothetical protein [Burkholderia cepacia]MCA8401411.1 hypothetical protein [Burkholderia cepacia]
MIDRATYQRLLDTHGRFVATRAFVAEQQPERRDWTSFYACYGDEQKLPENERCRTGVLHQFDPLGWTQHYANHPCDENSVIYLRTEGQSAYWLDQLVKTRETWGKWLGHFIYKSLICDESNDVYDAIADDQGEFVTIEDGATFCAWFEGWCGWAAWSASLSDDDIATLGEVFAWVRGEEQAPHRWPNPGTPEAAALMSKWRKQESAEPQQENKQ